MVFPSITWLRIVDINGWKELNPKNKNIVGLKKFMFHFDYRTE